MFNGFYEEWLRDGVVVEGPTWVLGAPASFAHIIQSADEGHSVRSAVKPCTSSECYASFAQSSNAITPISCPIGSPPGGYVHAGAFAQIGPTATVSVQMRVESDMRLIPQYAYDHVQGTIAIQDGGGPITNWLEAGIGVFGDRTPPDPPSWFVPHYWAYYQAPGNRGFWDLGPVTNFTQAHPIELRYVGNQTWQVFIHNSPTAAQGTLTGIQWATTFSEDHNETNSNCNPHHITYLNASHQMITSPHSDAPYDDLVSSSLCHHWNSYYNWEIYWQSDAPHYCTALLGVAGISTAAPPFHEVPVADQGGALRAAN